MCCFPREVFMPQGMVVGVYDNYTDRTVSNHKINPYDKNQIRDIREGFMGIMVKGEEGIEKYSGK